jgi:hypothetical protein
LWLAVTTIPVVFPPCAIARAAANAPARKHVDRNAVAVVRNPAVPYANRVGADRSPSSSRRGFACFTVASAYDRAQGSRAASADIARRRVAARRAVVAARRRVVPNPSLRPSIHPSIRRLPHSATPRAMATARATARADARVSPSRARRATRATATTRGAPDDSRALAPTATFATTTASTRDDAVSRAADALASVDAATCATALALAFVTARWRAATRERRRWRDEARRLDEANQELEWRLRVATAESDGADDLRRRRSTPRARPASAPATSPPTDARDVLVDGLRAETEALRAALAQARAAQK